VSWQVILGRLAGLREAVTFALLVAAFASFALASPDFVGALNFSFILTNAVEVGLMALPMTMLIVMGEIDISVGSMLGLSTAVLGILVLHGVSFVLAALLSLFVGAVTGLVNGLLCTAFRLPSLVLTLGTYALYRGLAEVVLGTQSVSTFPSWYVGWNTRYVVGLISYPEVFWFFCTLIAIVVLHQLRFGRLLTFIGANPVAARYSGVRINNYRVLMFAVSGLTSAVAGLVLVSRLGSLDNTAGSGFELIVITAVLLGGTDFRGGRGTILGSFLAILLINVVENGLELVGVSAQITTAIVGALLVASVLIELVSAAGRRSLFRRRASGMLVRTQVAASEAPQLRRERRRTEQISTSSS
jgi:rhamnose transport system permease protein